MPREVDAESSYYPEEKAVADCRKPQAPGERLGLGRDGHGQFGLPVTLNHALASATPTATTSTFSRFAHASYAPRAIMSKVPACPAFLQTTSAAVAAGAFMIGVGARNSRADFDAKSNKAVVVATRRGGRPPGDGI